MENGTGRQGTGRQIRVMKEILEQEQRAWRICSKRYDTLEPAKGMESKWDVQRERCEVLREIIQAYESEPVRKAIAGWQEIIMAEDRRGEHHELTI